jgi:ubiquinone/menaquinone biosynthesis C-methylase UbiE
MESEDFSPISQSDIFLASEGDAWFLRNSDFLETTKVFHSVDFIVQTLDPFKSEICNVIEIGCGPGYKLEKLLVELQAEKGSGLDPSILSINTAKERTVNSENDLDFHVGISSSLPFSSNTADLVFLGFFLYLVPRDELSATVSEIDRVLKPGGFLAIEDFDAPLSIQNPYIHDDRVVTYKEDYSKYFLSSCGYHLIEKHSYSHESNTFSVNPQERIATSLLFKPFD